MTSLTSELLKLGKDGACSKEEFIDTAFDKNIVSPKERIRSEYLRMLEILGVIESIDKTGIIHLNTEILKFKGEVGGRGFWQYLSDFMCSTRYIHQFGYEFLDSNKEYLKQSKDSQFDNLRAYISKKIAKQSETDHELEQQFSRLRMSKEEWVGKGVDKKAITCVVSMYKLVNDKTGKNISNDKKALTEDNFADRLIDTFQKIKKPHLDSVTIKELKERMQKEYDVSDKNFRNYLKQNFYDDRLHFESGKPHHLTKEDGFKMAKIGGLETTYYVISARLK